MHADHQQRKCDPQLLYGYLEQKLTARDEAALEAHLDACEACRRRISDVAAEPVWWTDVERVTITDFGLARAADDGSVTRTGFIAGTPQYMSPEQARGESLDARSDLFSLGSVIYAMAAGRPPFRAESSYGILRRITDGSPKPLCAVNSEVPEWFASIVERLHAKSSGERFQSAEELAVLLEQCLAHVQQPTVSPLPPSLRKVRGARSRFHRRLAGGVASLVAAGALAAALAWGLGNRNRDAPPDGAMSARVTASSESANSRTRPPGTARWEDGVREQLHQVESTLPQFEQRAAQQWDTEVSTASLPDAPAADPARPSSSEESD